jgi:Plasmid pRiA4b ORF-3-like protein
MHDDIDNKEAAFRELVRVLEEAVQAGANSLGMEYEDRDLIVYYNFGNTGLGAARIPKELQQLVIRELVKRAGLSRRRNGTMQVSLVGEDYEVQVKEYENFGESAFTLTLKQKTKKAEEPTLLALKKPTGKKAAAAHERPSSERKVRIYTLVVFLPRTPINKTFAKKKSGVSRTIQIRGDQTLEDLHHAIFDAFDRDEEHMYEFQLGRGARDRQGPTYVVEDYGAGNIVGFVTDTTIDSLRLNVGRSFGYLFDFGDQWQHQINVEVIEEMMPQVSFPRVTKRVGKSPPQYPDEYE